MPEATDSKIINRTAIDILNLLYDSTGQAVAAIIVGVSLMTFFLDDIFPQNQVFSWSVFMLVVAFYRVVVKELYKRAPITEEKVAYWRVLFVAGTALIGIGWGVAGWFFIVPGHELYQTLLSLTIIGYSAGAMTSLSAYMPAFLSLFIPATGALTLRTLYIGGKIDDAIAFMMVFFIAFIIAAARRQNKIFVHTLNTSYANEELIENLKQQKDVTDALNVTLEVEIDERRKTAKQLLAAMRKAEEATIAKSDFLANMSHEIRTPMNAIIGMSHLALQTELTNKQYHYVDKINRSANSLLGIINDILDFSKIESGNLELECTEFRLEDVMDNLISVVGLRSEEKGLELLFDIGTDVPTALKGDPLRLGQVLVNLGNNAVKFTEQGEIVIRISVLKEDDESVTLKFSVRDSGIGISKEEQEKLFVAFSQADASTTRKFGGTGLGLVISMRLVELMDGELWVESRKGSGSIFTFTAEFLKQEGEVSKRRAEMPRVSGNVLVVDDNEAAREILSAMLTEFGYRVDQADSGYTAMKQLEEHPDYYQLIIMDWKMPEMDGFETTQAIRNNDKIDKIPTVIMASAYDREEARKMSGDLDIKGYMTKPVTASTLYDSISNAFGETTEYPRKRDRKKNANENIENLRGAHVLLVEDNEINQDLAIELLSSNGIHVTVANDGQQALKILQGETFDGILMDIQMPVMDGYTATRRIRLQDKYKELPILAMTANAIAGDREKALEAGMNDHIPKPFHPDELFRIMSKWIKPSRQEPARKNREKADVEIPDLEGINTELGLERTANNKPFYLKIMKKVYINKLSFVHDFDELIEAGDWETAHRLAHTMKSVAGNIGAEKLQELLQVIENESKEKQLNRDHHTAMVTEFIRVMNSLSELP